MVPKNLVQIPKWHGNAVLITTSQKNGMPKLKVTKLWVFFASVIDRADRHKLWLIVSSVARPAMELISELHKHSPGVLRMTFACSQRNLVGFMPGRPFLSQQIVAMFFGGLAQQQSLSTNRSRWSHTARLWWSSPVWSVRCTGGYGLLCTVCTIQDVMLWCEVLCSKFAHFFRWCRSTVLGFPSCSLIFYRTRSP